MVYGYKEAIAVEGWRGSGLAFRANYLGFYEHWRYTISLQMGLRATRGDDVVPACEFF